MNILLDAGIAAVAAALLGYGFFWGQSVLVRNQFIRGLAAKNRGEYELAEACFTRCTDSGYRLKLAALASDARILASWVSIEQGQYGRALHLLSVYQLPYAGLSPLIPTAWVAVQRNDLATAEAALEQALRTFGRGTMAYASTLCVLGWLRVQQGRLKEAEKHLNESLLECRRITGGDTVFCVPPMMNLAWLHLLTGQLERATELSMKAVSIYGRALGPSSPRTANALALRGVIALVLDEPELALRDLFRAKRVFKKHDLMDKPSGRCLASALSWITK